MSDAQALALQLQQGRVLTPSRRAKLISCALLVPAGAALALAAEGDAVLVGFGAVIAVVGAVFLVLVAFGWSGERRTWLAREGVVFETAAFRYHIPWEALREVKLVGASLLRRVQLTVRDVEEVAGTVRLKRRGGRRKAQTRVRRVFGLNYRAGKCHVEFMASALGVDAAALHAALVGFRDDADRRAGLLALPVLEDTSG